MMKKVKIKYKKNMKVQNLMTNIQKRVHNKKKASKRLLRNLKQSKRAKLTRKAKL